MLLVALALLCVASVPLRGRSLAGILRIEPRGLWLVGAALVVQIAVTSAFPAGHRVLHAALHLASYGLAAAFVLANRRIPGILVMAAGGALNLAAIAANGGTMPALPAAVRAAGLELGGGWENSGPLAHPRLAWLGDVLPVPGPLANVLSAGDLIIYAGLLLLLHRMSTPRRLPSLVR